jgi:xylulokinase
MKTVLVVDLGTTFFKGCLFDEEGTLAALERRPLTVSHPVENWWELDAEEFKRAIRELVHAVLAAGQDCEPPSAFCFATQTNSFLLLDEADRPLTPIILWPDQREGSPEFVLQQMSQSPGFRAATGVPALTPEFAAAKLLWLRETQPKVWRQARRFCLISDYLARWLTGRHATEAGAAGLLGLLDVHTLQWLHNLCDMMELPSEWLPEVLRAGSHVDVLRPSVAEELGLPAHCTCVMGCLDQYAGAIGAGNVAPGGLSETTGTVLATVGCTKEFDPEPPPGLFQGPAYEEGLYYRMAFGEVSANLLERYHQSLQEAPGYDVLAGEASEIDPGADGLRIVERPEWVPAEKLFAHERPEHSRAHRTRAILERVAFELRAQVDILTHGAMPQEIRSVGGAARSKPWLQIKANVLGTPFSATQCPEPTSLGAALLAIGALTGEHVGAAAERIVRTAPLILPQEEHVRQYERLREDILPG